MVAVDALLLGVAIVAAVGAIVGLMIGLFAKPPR